jgi:hypothetical protein
MTDYKNGKIYMLINDKDINSKIYIGSTCDELRKRLYRHRGKINDGSETTVYNYFRNAKLSGGNMCIILIKNYPCKKKVDLVMEERKIINIYKPELNIRSPITFLYEQITNYTCDCGRIIQLREKIRHNRTLVHNGYLSILMLKKLRKYFDIWKNKIYIYSI